MMNDSVLRVAVLDMNNGNPNQGMRCILDILSVYSDDITVDIFDVRKEGQVPDLSYEMYISSGGPGDPLKGDGNWDRKWQQLILDIDYHNKHHHDSPKYAFLICHSFQMACHLFGVAKVTRRRKMSFGTYTCFLTAAGEQDPIFNNLPNPFWIADFRSYQVVQADWDRIEQMEAKILAREKPREHVPLEQAIMAMQFSPEIYGTQFHPEADAEGMKRHFETPKMKKKIIKEYGLEKYEQMLRDLSIPDRIDLTNQLILPSFLSRVIHARTGLISVQ